MSSQNNTMRYFQDEYRPRKGSEYRTGQSTEVQEQCKQHMPTKGAAQQFGYGEEEVGWVG